jgi:signal peptidase II
MQAARGASLTPSDPDGPSTDHRRPAARRSLGLFFGVGLVVYVLDQGTKALAVDRLEQRAPVHVVGDLVQLVLVRNPGAAFSTGTSYTIVLTVVALIAAVAVLLVARRLRNRLWALGLGCLLGGVLGNLTDRIFREPSVLRGHVVDFIALPHWPVFNVADMSINVAAAVIIVQALRGVSVSGDRSRAADRDADTDDAGADA